MEIVTKKTTAEAVLNFAFTEAVSRLIPIKPIARGSRYYLFSVLKLAKELYESKESRTISSIRAEFLEKLLQIESQDLSTLLYMPDETVKIPVHQTTEVPLMFGISAKELKKLIKEYKIRTYHFDFFIHADDLEQVLGKKFKPLGHPQLVSFVPHSYKTELDKSRRKAADDLRALARSYYLAADELIKGTLTRSPADLMMDTAKHLKSLETYRDDEMTLI